MNIKVLYHSMTGNTGKVAHAIADALHVEAETIRQETTRFPDPVDLLFIGDGIYAGHAHKKTRSLIKQLEPVTIKNVAVFATYGGHSGIGAKIQQMLVDRGLQVIGEPFTCKGQAWLFINRKRPNESDLALAREFALAMAQKVAAK
ncbi:MAG: nitric oxide synthase [Planctomycetota bacterium]|jgi:flavodoxin|nr:nitric oxide synthase [Planctomycetota bacterium]